METIYAIVYFYSLEGLGNFLSGMETKKEILKVGWNIGLGNFLSGMETSLVLIHGSSLF